jgi:hypothetical protein
MIMYETRGLGTQNSTNYDAAYGDVKLSGCNRHAEALVEPPRRAESASLAYSKAVIYPEQAHQPESNIEA